MDENLRSLLYAFYGLGVNDADRASGAFFVTPRAEIDENFERHLSKYQWDGVRAVRS